MNPDSNQFDVIIIGAGPSGLIDIIAPTQKTVDALSRLEMPAGVYIDIKMKSK